MRGKDTNDANTGATVGITPAYAGKSCRSPQGAGRAWDHPRVCGEKMMATAEAKAMEGSPPRMRGKVVADCGPKNTARITPAYAGKSLPAGGCLLLLRDHPRVCGEKISFVFTACSPMGSPPRMRGKVVADCGPKNTARITPAYAGKSLPAGGCLLLLRDHPRVCGEKISFVFTACSPMGSPPRMRGKVPFPISVSAFVRITPAYAGKSKF